MRHHGVMGGAVRAVLFDADGVVQTSNPVVDAIGRLCGWDAAVSEAFLHDLWRREEELGCLVGTGDLLAEVGLMLDERGVSHDAGAFYNDLLAATIVPAQHVLSLVDELRSAGIYCGLATNQERMRLTFMTDALGYGARFDRVFGSCEMGLRKPSAEYFEAIVRALELPAGEVLFLDDHAPNVESALRVGLRAEVVAHPDDVGGYLQSHGLPRSG